jgi:rRNA-processing protein FCF1
VKSSRNRDSTGTEQGQAGDESVEVFVFPDTNVFLHFQFFDEVDWAAQLGVKRVRIVLTQPVLAELDDHKFSGTRREKARAQKVLKRLDALDLSTKPVQLRPGVSVVALDSEPTDAVFGQHRLSPQINDDRLAASVLEFIDANPGCRAIVVTDDTGLRVKARARGLEVVTPAESLRSEEEQDETERALEATRRELAAARSAVPKLHLTFKSGDHLELTAKLVAPLEAATRERLLSDWRARHPLVSATPDSLVMLDGKRVDMSILRSVPGYLSQQDAEAGNATIDRYFQEYRTYLDAWPAMVNSYGRTIEISLVLENEGNLPADDVHLELWTDANGSWLEEQPDLERPPRMPKPRNMFEGLLRPQLPHFDVGQLRRHDEPIDGPNIPADDPTEVQYAVKRVKHRVPCALPKVHFQFATDGDIHSFAINYRLVAANIREPVEGALNIKVTLAAPVPAPNPEEVFERPEDDD